MGKVKSVTKKVMKITIRRGIKNGCSFCEILSDGKKVDHQESRDLTRTTGESGWGIFSRGNDGKIEFVFGDARKTFVVTPLDFDNDPVDLIASELQARIDAVTAWVSGIDREERISFALIGSN